MINFKSRTVKIIANTYIFTDVTKNDPLEMIYIRIGYLKGY